MRKKKHILVADHECRFRFAVTIALRKSGFRVSDAVDGEGVLEAIDRAGNVGMPVDLIVADIRLPRFPCLKMISARGEKGSRVPVFFVTGSDDQGLLSGIRSQCSIAFNHIEKPFVPVELVRRIDRILGYRETVAAAGGPEALPGGPGGEAGR